MLIFYIILFIDFRLFEKIIKPVNVRETTASLTPKSKTEKLIYIILLIGK